jgi:hypothetical protein
MSPTAADAAVGLDAFFFVKSVGTPVTVLYTLHRSYIMATPPLNIMKQSASELTLSNAVELASSVIKDIAGNDISNSLNGTSITKDLIQTLVLQRIQSQMGGCDAAR